MENNEEKTELKSTKKPFDKESLGTFAKKVGAASKKAVTNAKTAAKALGSEMQNMDREAQLKKYNPLFPDRFESADFHKPNIIVIVDDAVRKGIEVCEGAIGWLSKHKGVEVLHLYDEAVGYSGLRFVNAAMCDCAYCVDPHDRNRYLSVDIFYSTMQEEKLAELQHIAYYLGAKSYHVEMIEGKASDSSEQVGIGTGIKIVQASAGIGGSISSSVKRKSLASAAFQGKRLPQKPTLVWFKDDRNIQNLIDMCCRSGGKSDLSEYTIELMNTSSMSTIAAGKIDGAVKGIGLECNFEKKSKEEHSNKLVFRLTF